ncbi:MAG: putative methylase [Tepidanaerobacteraceae bacterium]|nr:putative methylase [Tepidanaerobacteraceae bacterium]
MLNGDKSFIEVQFPVSKVSKESYKERKAGSGQTLTGLGKWWGRKPLILVRAALLGLLMPASDNPKKDMEIFLKILTMDEEGLWLRKKQSIPIKEIYENLSEEERERYFENNNGKITYKKNVTKKEKEQLQKLVFNRLSYDEKLKYCVRPEEIDNLPESEWQVINQHLGTNAKSLQEFVRELGKKRFGKVPVVGDCFCGGGSVPFEAARMGFDVYASDLNPIAMLLTWASLNILGSSEEEIESLKEFQKKIFELADKQITEWGIEHNEQGHRANAYLYCNETICPECGWRVPLVPSWIIGKGTKTVAILKENPENKSFDIEIKSNATEKEMELAEKMATVKDSNLVCPHCKVSTPIAAIRKDRIKEDGSVEYGLRKWEAHEFIPRPDDVFQERLYCIRYETQEGKRYYTAPTEEDLKREEEVVNLLKERFNKWQEKGYIPSSMIEEGEETSRLYRERGWAYWHQLFNPRQLLMHGLLMELIDKHAETKKEKVVGLLEVNRCADWNSRLSRWDPSKSGGLGHTAQTFYNQALNTLFNYGVRGLKSIKDSWFFPLASLLKNTPKKVFVKLSDARGVVENCHIWLTDPPYADAINYHELSEFFLVWDKKMLLDVFPDWYADSKRALAIKGTGESFKQSMVEVYKNLAAHMPDNGLQIIMFTHQNVSVWADLALILWAAGLRVTAAWNIATETDASGLKKGNYVKGTVLLVLRKQTSEETAYLDELYPEIENEVQRQIDIMRELDDKEDPNFSDTDYLLAAYAASLKVLTSYKKIEDIDIQYELSKTRLPGEESPIEKIINEAVKIAYDYIIPKGFDSYTWKMLTPEERFYIKGLDLEKDGIYQLGAYQELAKGFGVREYRDLLASTRANKARLKTALEFGMKGLSSSDRFSNTLVRNVLAALYQAIKAEDTTKGRNWLKNELPNYWNQRNTIIEILEYISALGNIETMPHWKEEAKYARLLAELVKNDGV